jgi:hypothetical protein
MYFSHIILLTDTDQCVMWSLHQYFWKLTLLLVEQLKTLALHETQI